MRITIKIEDTEDGVRVAAHQELNGVQDHPSESLATMWAASLWLHMADLRRTAHAVIHTTPELPV